MPGASRRVARFSIGVAMFGLSLSACSPRSPTTQFQIDLCGSALQWQFKAAHWDALYTGQLPGERELTVALRIPRQPSQPERPDYDMRLQFNLHGEPGLLQADGAAALVGRFALRGDNLFERVEESTAPHTRRRASLAPSAETPASSTASRTGMAIVFGDKGVLWKGGAGELQITEVRVVAREERQGNGGLAIASGNYRFEAAPAAGGVACTISGSFKDATFRLRQ